MGNPVLKSKKSMIGSIIFTIVGIVVTFSSFKIGGKFLGGLLMIGFVINVSFYWTFILFKGNKEEFDEQTYRKIGSFALLTGILIGILNYLTITLLNFGTDNFFIGTAIIIPIFAMSYVVKIIFYLGSKEETVNFIRILLMGLLVDLGVLGTTLGLKFAPG